MDSEAGGTVAATTSFDDQLKVSRSVVARAIYAMLGFIFLGIGIAGFYTPVLPGTINLLAAAYFFSMSSERMFRWMMTNRVFGQQLQDYRAGLGIPRKIKMVAISSIIVSVALTVTLALDGPWARASMVLFGLFGIWFILTRPTRETELARRGVSVG
jgi:uncharacterized membrane protein YbaN (DUF454 family)